LGPEAALADTMLENAELKELLMRNLWRSLVKRAAAVQPHQGG
jgi:hypothetical protein